MIFMIWNDFDDFRCLSELGFLGFVWDSWDSVVVVWGFAVVCGGGWLSPSGPSSPGPLPPSGRGGFAGG